MAADPRDRHYFGYSDIIEGSLDDEINSFLKSFPTPTKKQEWIRRACAFMYAIDAGRIPVDSGGVSIAIAPPAEPTATVTVEQPVRDEKPETPSDKEESHEGKLSFLRGSLQV